MASLEYVTAGWLRSRRLTVASVGRAGAVEACALGPCPVREGDWGSGTFCRLVGVWVGAAGGGLGSTSGGSSPVYLVPVWALFSSVRSRMGWALVSSRV